MFEPTKRVCDACHNREASHHTVTIVQGVECSRNLCSDCFGECGHEACARTRCIVRKSGMRLLWRKGKCGRERFPSSCIGHSGYTSHVFELLQ